jgi:hypothetical protein
MLSLGSPPHRISGQPIVGLAKSVLCHPSAFHMSGSAQGTGAAIDSAKLIDDVRLAATALQLVDGLGAEQTP